MSRSFSSLNRRKARKLLYSLLVMMSFVSTDPHIPSMEPETHAPADACNPIFFATVDAGGGETTNDVCSSDQANMVRLSYSTCHCQE
jgi:hypothetical protein